MPTYRPIHPVHECLVNTTHGMHDWWYVSRGGGHQLRHGFTPDATDGHTKKWHCPGKVME